MLVRTAILMQWFDRRGLIQTCVAIRLHNLLAQKIYFTITVVAFTLCCSVWKHVTNIRRLSPPISVHMFEFPGNGNARGHQQIERCANPLSFLPALWTIAGKCKLCTAHDCTTLLNVWLQGGWDDTLTALCITNDRPCILTHITWILKSAQCMTPLLHVETS